MESRSGTGRESSGTSRNVQQEIPLTLKGSIMSTENTNATVSTEQVADEKPSMQSHAAWVASQQPIDTSKNAPKQVATPAQQAKTKAKAQSKPLAKAQTGDWTQINYIVRGDGAAKLFAHTAAWLELTGLIHGKSAPEDLVRELGGSALRYHTRQGNFVSSQGMTSLTPKGMNHFSARQTGTGRQTYAQEDMEHYMLMMMEGIKDDRLIKSEGTIRKIVKE
jgi:hypothetical protein